MVAKKVDQMAYQMADCWVGLMVETMVGLMVETRAD